MINVLFRLPQDNVVKLIKQKKWEEAHKAREEVLGCAQRLTDDDSHDSYIEQSHLLSVVV